MVTWQLTIDANNPTRLVEFWAPVLGYEVQPPPDGFATQNDYYRSIGVPDDELDLDGDGTDRIFDPRGEGPKIWFQAVPERKSGKNRFHLDIYPTGRDRSLPLEERRRIVDAKVAELVERAPASRAPSPTTSADQLSRRGTSSSPCSIPRATVVRGVIVIVVMIREQRHPKQIKCSAMTILRRTRLAGARAHRDSRIALAA